MKKRNPEGKGESVRFLFKVVRQQRGGAVACSTCIRILPQASPLLASGESE